ncbi:TIGR03668 family PPOX class F420-dependent oxidoreductase [Natrinema sp. CBA1119]|uniref:TIGR03668 family PPOX class F420-dependent oxidoreductase n=1 Tax=Natrinema sp. CBA1119 TaxID=1608465 RepID=UPI000BF41DE9|nr:TIGR03668 family PPOX class F420-dependent oxidoreductase [Natrinema sp. CBA1119]PGF16426.1 TIGR03668 family PPOX class F420-dependent oxidoreductase [Natrinema sp. CBA1119]
MTPDERAFLERARVGSLATVDEENRPHVVPICFALLERPQVASPTAVTNRTASSESRSADGGANGRIVSAIDEKPKATRDLRRVRNIRTNPQVTVLVDRYREDWSRLAWVQVRGRARILEPEVSGHHSAVHALESKYDQYAAHDLDERPIVSIRVDRTVSWGALEDPEESVEEEWRP